MGNTIEFNTAEEARQFATQGSGPYLVLSRETLDQIEAAEAAGGFEGGMSGASGEGGYSDSGTEAADSSSASDSARIEFFDMDGAVRAGAFLEGVTEKILELRDVWEAFHGNPLGPVILVPKEELDRWLGNSGPSA
jgi:hypothetical protein